MSKTVKNTTQVVINWNYPLIQQPVKQTVNYFQLATTGTFEQFMKRDEKTLNVGRNLKTLFCTNLGVGLRVPIPFPKSNSSTFHAFSSFSSTLQL